jgi:hypothetical protein
MAEKHRPGDKEQQDPTADCEGMHRDAEIGEQPPATDEEKQGHAEGDYKRPSESISFFDVPSSPGKAMKLGATPSGSTTTNRATKRLQGELPEIFVHVRVQ